MANVIAERQLKLRTGADVVLRLFQPEKGEVDWGCRYEIIWPDRDRHFRVIYGIDGLQALFFAMKMAHAELLLSQESKSGGLLWLGERDLELPLPDNLKDLA